MPDVVIVGGGIIGTACADDLARRGVRVTLVERDELAAGASGRNQGWFVLSADPACTPMSRISLDTYLEIVDGSPVPVWFDRDPIGHLMLTSDEGAMGLLRERAEAWAATGVRLERVGPSTLHEIEPALSHDIGEAWLLDHGRRVEPGALTVALALRAKGSGADLRLHTTARKLTTARDRVTGVVTDGGVIAADVVVLAAGPWSASLLRPLGVELPVTGARGWIVELSPPPEPIHHLVEEERGQVSDERFPTASELAASATREPHVEALLHGAPDGSVVCGASHHPALRAEPEDTDAPSRIASGAIRLMPSLADVPVRSVRWGIRPMSPDGRPLIGWLRDGLLVATGHGPEGVLLGGGTGALVGSMLVRDPPPFDPAGFDPLRFG